MKASLNSSKKSLTLTTKKALVFLVVFVTLFSFLFTPLHQAKAQFATFDSVTAAWTAGDTFWKKITNTLKTLWQKAGSQAFQQVVRTAAKKIAYDTANYLGSGGKGQKPLFITEDWGSYLTNIADEAAGQFVENFAANLSNSEAKARTALRCQEEYISCSQACSSARTLEGDNPEFVSCLSSCKDASSKCGGANSGSASGSAAESYMNAPSFNVCQPSSVEAKLRISLGLVEYTRPGQPNCTASDMVRDWGDEVKRLTDFRDPNFLQKFKNIFNPVSNDLGILMSARMDMSESQAKKEITAKTDLEANKGWISVRNLANKTLGTPGEAEMKRDSAGNLQEASFGKVTGDIVIDAANVFLNQLAISAFNNLMSNLGKKASEDNLGTNSTVLTKADADPGVRTGEGNLKEATASIIKPDFDVRADYDILSALSICPDSKNPGPANCVVDDKFRQGITERKTVIEAIKDGYLHGEWQFSQDLADNAYSARNISILRKYRILPIGWEEAVKQIYADRNSVRKVTLMDLISCFDATDNYNQFSTDFNTRDQEWCRGLIDPNWVLKSPLNYCAREGVGAHILNTIVTPSIAAFSSSPYMPSSLTITRADEYCGDEKTCIKEKKDGSCEVYGYCNEEKRTWKFSGDTCEPINNTCESFTNIATGKSVAYLENTLDYGDCSSDSAGCRRYATNGNFDLETNRVEWEANSSVYLNKNLSSCNSKNEGCSEFLRVKPTWGANLIAAADYFSHEVGDLDRGGDKLGSWPYFSSANTVQSDHLAMIVEASQEPGGAVGKALKLEANRLTGASGQIVTGIYSDKEESLLPENFQLVSGQSYTLSASVYLTDGNTVKLSLGRAADGIFKSISTVGEWVTLSITRIADGTFNDPVFSLNAESAGSKVKFYIKNVKFEMSNFATGFSSYGSHRIYEKLIPSYLEKACYIDSGSATKDYRLRSDAPAECAKFTRKCNASEVGCELFTNSKTGLSVAAQVKSSDYCPGECLGYDVYISKESYFNSPQAENIIPANSRVCSAESVGCSEFTNLDELAKGGESKEYYSTLKQCIKPSASLCGNFYSWEGTEGGYQLRLFNLQKTTQGGPAVTSSDSELCSSDIYNRKPGDPLYNADCREFYNSAGATFYHLISRTITCSENCHAYRLSQNNVDSTLTRAQCEASPSTKYWNASSGECISCLNGGLWDNQLKACVYQAIPGEGKSCSASEVGCREYNGSDGNNVRMILTSDFESGLSSWNSNCANGVELSTISNNRNGHSLFYRDTASSCSPLGQQSSTFSKAPIIKQALASNNVGAQIMVGLGVAEGRAYSLRFIARAANDTQLVAYFFNNDKNNPQRADFDSSNVVIKGGNEWQLYQINLDNLDHAVTANEMLIISANQDFYFDSVVLTEITDRYYLVRGSSQIPDICYYDIFDKYQGADYNLGCSQYIDKGGLKHNLHQFSKICSESAVGCEQMIDTKNYAPGGSGIWNDLDGDGVCGSDEEDCVKVDADQAIYAIYDATKQCNGADLGCSLLGQGSADATIWSNVYKKNNPNLYDKLLCSEGDLGCEEWQASDGSLNYFRDPANNVCQYRSSKDPLVTGKAWYRVPVKRCDLDSSGSINGAEKTSKICGIDKDCVSGKCIVDDNDYACTTSYFKTFGLGGGGNQVPVPDEQAGLCEKAAAGCTEYIDPVSQINANLVYNPGFEKKSDGSVEGWTGTEQVISLDPNKLYSFSVIGTTTTGTSLRFSSGVKELLSDNNLATTTKTTLSLPANAKQAIIFASLGGSRVTVSGGEAGKIIILRELIINYQLASEVDKKSCNGEVSLDNGCLLLNERQVAGPNGLASLSFDAASSFGKKSPVNCQPGGACTANQLVKVSPDRVCSKWLDCLTYVEDPVTKEKTCYAVGECTRLDDKNECASFEDSPKNNLNFSIANPNASGYYLLNQYNVSNMQEVGYDSDAHYDFEDNLPSLNCRRALDGGACQFRSNIITDLLVREPENAPVKYPANGASYLKVPSAFVISPHSDNNPITVLPNKDYFINFLLNSGNSGLEGEIVIRRASDNAQVAVLKSTSNNAWTRKVLSFNTGNTNAIKIELRTSNPNSDRNVYFDDINLEPVLKVADDKYVARECRLYPTENSLTCVNKNNNVLKDGWEGYCLEHDPNNPSVCLMWYPVDSISSSRLQRSSAGYQGKMPLNYCTEVDGNFDVVDKREAFFLKGYNDNENCSNNPYRKIGFDYTNEIGGCQVGYVGFYYEYQYLKHSFVINNNNCLGGYWCVPKEETATFQVIVKKDDSQLEARPFVGGGFSGYKMIFSDDPSLVVGPSADDNYSSPSTYTISLVSGSDGWYKYTGDIPKVNGKPELPDNPVRVYDYNRPPADEEGLKLLSGSDKDKIFRLTCKSFIQTVDPSGANRAWASRTGSNSSWPTTTPPYFVDIFANNYGYYGNISGSEHLLSAYGRNRQDTPFGAALWPDNFNLLSGDPVKLRNQFSTKNNEDVLAGRPFGCSNYNASDKGSGCSNIGYCSLDPNVYCLYAYSSDSYVSTKTCADAGLGKCLPLWGDYLGKNGSMDFVPILQQLFLKSYNAYSLKDGAYIPSNLSINQESMTACPGNVRPVATYDNISAAKGSFCAVKPKVGNKTLKFNGKTVTTVDRRGVYALEFTTEIDPEQQPLKQIYINWGDGSEQVIAGQDSRPGVSSPHVFYHYFRQESSNPITIRVTDNWAQTAEIR